MNKSDQDQVELDVYLEPMIEAETPAGGDDDSEPTIICVSHCK
jgi:hypothetical protein